MRKLKLREKKGLAGSQSQLVKPSHPSFPSQPRTGHMLPEQEEEAKQLGRGRVQAENYTSQEAGCFQPRRGQEKDEGVRAGHQHAHTCTCAHVYTHIHDTWMPFLWSPGWCCECVCVCVCLSLAGRPQVGDPCDRNQSLDWALVHGSSASCLGQVEGDTDPQLLQVTEGRYDESWWGGRLWGHEPIDSLHFPQLGGSRSDLSLGQPSCLAWEGQLA